MKKLMSAVLVLMLMLSYGTVFAATDEQVLNALFNSNYLSGELDMEIGIKPNAPLPVFMDPAGSQTQTLSDMKYTYHIKYDISEDRKKVKTQMDMTMAMPGSDAVTLSYWIDMDFSNTEKPVCKAIIKQQGNEKYMYIDYANNPVLPVTSLMPAYFNIDQINNTNAEIMKGINKSKYKPQYKDGKYIIVLDENTVKDMFKTIALAMSGNFMSYFTAPKAASVEQSVYEGSQTSQNTLNGQSQKAEYEKAVTEFFDKLKDVQVLDKDAMVMEVELNDQNLIKHEKVSVNIKTNVAELMQAFDGTDDTVTKENSNLDVSLLLDYDFRKTNESVDIVFPELTVDNSVDMLQPQQRPIINEDKINVVVNDQRIPFETEPFVQDNRAMVPLRELARVLGASDDEIFYEEGNIDIRYGNTLIQLSVDSNVAHINGQAVELDVPVTMVDHKVFIPDTFISKAFNCDVRWTPLYKGENDTISGGIVHITYNKNAVVKIVVPFDIDVRSMKMLDEASAMTGINIQLNKTEPENYRDKARIMVAAGEPSVIMGSDQLDQETVRKLCEIDAFVPLNDYIEKYTFVVKTMLDNNPDIRKVITQEDGNIYAFPVIKTGEANKKYDTFFITKAVKSPKDAVILLERYSQLLAGKELGMQQDKRPVTIAVPDDKDMASLIEKAGAIAGINVNIVAMPVDQAQERMMLMIAAGEPVTFFGCQVDSEWQDKLITQGAIPCLDQYIESDAPHIREFLDKNPEYKQRVTNEDGHIYFLPLIDSNGEEKGVFFISNTAKDPQDALKCVDYFYTEEGRQLMADR